MSASRSVGRVRGLAAALGIGAALLTGGGLAAADSGRSDSSADTGAARANEQVKEAPARGPAAKRAARVPAPSAATRASRAAAASGAVPAVDPESVSAARKDGLGSAARKKAPRAVSPARTRVSARLAQIAEAAVSPATAAAIAQPVVPSVSGRPSVSEAPVSWPPALSAVVSRPAKSNPLPALASVLRSAPGLPPVDPSTTANVALLAVTALIQIATVMGVAALTPAPPTPGTVSPTLNLKGFDVVPNSTEEVTSIYGRWTYLPGAPSLVQGRQQFAVVDPATTQTIGTFDALVSKGSGIDYTTLLVTATDGTNVGTDAGQVPPVGSLVSHFQIGQIGLSYSAMPTASGDLVSFTISTPWRDFDIDVPFDAAKGIADRTVDNRPIELGNGYSIAPADPAGETFTGISGILPLFTTVQGHQIFNVYDSAGQSVGSFDGIFTTTSDIIGTYTQAVMVTATDGNNVGTEAGQVPPVGTVYNVIYRESDEHFFLYTSMPDPAGNKVSVIEVDHGKVTNSALTLIDASAPPAFDSLTAANGYRFVPVSELKPSGINGLPPRDVQVQGYQRFDVYDAAGTRIGSVDTDVSTQWDAFGVRSKALLVTRVNEGTSGTGATDVPPPGSVFNFLTSGDSGFKSAHAVVPSTFSDLTTFAIETPDREIPFTPSVVPVASRAKVHFYSPFQPS